MAVNKLVSIIIPVYNVEEYLDECLNSVVNQTYNNIEIILINDGSVDSSKDICKAWSNKDDRIKFFDNENRGVSYTRNFGVRYCAGEYIAFIDSDDVVADNYIEALVELIENENADMSIVSYCAFRSGIPDYLNSDNKVLCCEELENIFFTLTKGMPWGKLFKRDIIFDNSIKFNNCIFVCEDLLFNLDYVKFCNRCVFSYSKLYGYRLRSNGLAHNNTSLRWFTVLKAYDRLFDEYSDNVIFTSVVFYYLKFLYEAKYLMKKNGISSSDIDFNVSSAIKRVEKRINVLPFKKRLKLFICKHFFSLVLKQRG